MDTGSYIKNTKASSKTRWPVQIPLGQDPDDEAYDMSRPNMGIALIFNHQVFDDALYKERVGTQQDCDAMAGLMKKLGFHVQIYQDYPLAKLRDALYIVSKMDHSDSNCLVVAVMTHGHSLDLLAARDDLYSTNDLFKAFDGLRCPSLRGKPKLFFIQACRGDNTDPGVKLVQADSGRKVQKQVYTIPTMSDILVMYASVEGYSAWRDQIEGSWFIQTLVKKLEKHHHQRDLLSILTMVNREVAIGFESSHNYEQYDKKKEMCSIVSMLTRELYFVAS